MLRRFHVAARLGGGWVTCEPRASAHHRSLNCFMNLPCRIHHSLRQILQTAHQGTRAPLLTVHTRLFPYADPWRNSTEAPLRQKGCFVTRIDRRQGSTSCGACAGGGVDHAYPIADADLLADEHAHVHVHAQHARGSGELRSPRKYIYAGVGYFGQGDALGGDYPRPPPVPPSAAAAKAATAALKALLARPAPATSTGNGGGRGAASGEAWDGLDERAALEAIVSDARGDLAAAAAEITCWEATEMPVELAALLRDHAMGHLRDFHAKMR